MPSRELSRVEALKISLLSNGIAVSQEASDALTCGGTHPLAIPEYPTTGGLTMLIGDDVYVNAPFDVPFSSHAEATLEFDQRTSTFSILYGRREFVAQVLPLPGYLAAKDSAGRFVTDVVFSHVDRARVSPISGCAYACSFCDFLTRPYNPRPVDQILEALTVAMSDQALPARHVLISGGTPKPKDYAYFDDVCRAVISSAGVAVDIMMPPRRDTHFIESLAEWGIHSYSINLEVFDQEIARRLVPQKRALGLEAYANSITRAVQCTGGNGRVRSLVLVGLEPLEQTLRGVEFLARLGCDPVLSPFRPTAEIPLFDYPPPNFELLERTYLEAREITERLGVKLGPRCIPCQHNTLTFADQSGAYFYS